MADMRDTVFVALGCLVAGLLVLGLPSVGVPLCALSLAWLMYRRGPAITAVVIAAATAVVAVRGPFEGVLVAVVLAVAGPYAATAMRKRSPWHVAGVLTVVLTAATVAALAVESAASGISLGGLWERMLAVFLEGLRESAGASNLPASEVEMLTGVLRQVFYQWPALLIVERAFAALLAVYAVGMQARRAGVEGVRTLPPLDRLDLTWHLTWGVIAGLALLAAARFTGQPDGLASILGLNVMRVTGSLLVLQGFAVFAGLYRKAGVKPLGRALGYTVLAVTEPLTAVLVPMGLVGLTGLVDLWVNIRKLPRGSEPDSAEELLREPIDDEA